MNKFIIIIILLGSTGESIYSQRKIFQPVLNYTGDIVGNFSGGDKRSIQYMGLVDAGFSINTDYKQYLYIIEPFSSKIQEQNKTINVLCEI